MHDEPMVRLEGVGKRYGAVHAVSGVDLTVAPGRIVGLVGHNGAGKSTLLKMMLGILAPSEGRLRIAGQDVGGPGFRQLRRQIGYLPENVVLYDNLDGLETLRFFARLKSVDPSQCEALLERVGLAAAARRNVRGYSKGMRQRLGFAQALLGSPRLMFLDEPTNGLDPLAIHAFYDTLQALREAGTTVLISSHLLAEIQSRLDDLAILANGRLVATGTVAALAADAALPARARITPEPDAHAAVQQALTQAGFAVAAVDAATLACDVPHARKARLLAALGPLEQALRGFELQEPTLEDLYLHHQHKAEAAA